MTHNRKIQINVDGNKILCCEGISIIQALWSAGISHVKSTGCMEGVCGSCRVLVRDNELQQVKTELACRVIVKQNMQIYFVPPTYSKAHSFTIDEIRESKNIQHTFRRIFTESVNCRQCGGCDLACPKGIEVEKSVQLAIKGKFNEVSELFTECVLCDFCEDVCPELIAPNHIGMFSRQVHSLTLSHPVNLVRCLQARNKI